MSPQSNVFFSKSASFASLTLFKFDNAVASLCSISALWRRLVKLIFGNGLGCSSMLVMNLGRQLGTVMQGRFLIFLMKQLCSFVVSSASFEEFFR